MGYKIRGGEACRRAREALGLSQQAIADRIGMSQALITAYEANREPLSLKARLRICQALSIPRGRLLSPEEMRLIAPEAA